MAPGINMKPWPSPLYWKYLSVLDFTLLMLDENWDWYWDLPPLHCDICPEYTSICWEKKTNIAISLIQSLVLISQFLAGFEMYASEWVAILF